MEHIVFLDRSTVRADIPRPSFPHTWTEYERSISEEVISRAQDATIVISNKVRLTSGILASLPKLAMIAIPATGMDHVDLVWCAAHNVHVANCQTYSSRSVPEHAVGFMIALRRNLLAFRSDVLGGQWQTSDHFYLSNHPIRDLYDATVGIVGKGSLGIGTARLCEAFGARVLYAEHKTRKNIRSGYTPFAEVLRQADIVSLHCPLTTETRQLIGAPELTMMRKDAVLINTARGGLIDESALLEALKNSEIAGAALDVLSAEPPRDGSPLLEIELPNLIITPHVAWISDASMAALARELLQSVELFVQRCRMPSAPAHRGNSYEG
jgi:glycerate dehydrogenase